MRKVYCIGELLIDFISPEHGLSLKDAKLFEKKAGGAPANVCVASQNTGANTYFLGQVGNDAFGAHLAEVVGNAGVNLEYMVKDGKTTLAFVSLAEDGERSFDFFRGSDGEYQVQDELLATLRRGDIVHFGSATGLLPGTLKKSYFTLLEKAKEVGALVVFDPNYRDLLVTDVKQFIEDSLYFLQYADVIKLSEEEAALLTGKETLDEALEVIHSMTKGIVTVTLGHKGTLVYVNGEKQIIPSVKISALDTTGAGDCFVGTLIGQIAQLEEVELLFNEDVRTQLITYANVAAALTCTKYGAIAALPTRDEIRIAMEAK